MTGVVPLLLLALAVLLAFPRTAQLPADETTVLQPLRPSGDSLVVRHRAWGAGLAGVGAFLLVGGRSAPLVAVVASGAAWVALGRVEPAEVGRQRDQIRRDLPHLVDLLAAALRSGSAPGEAVAVVCAACAGPAADRLEGVTVRLALGTDPAQVWESLSADPDLAPLGRALARSQSTGASVVTSVERLADELASRARADVEERARAVGVKAALPLGLCLLPAFILIGIVPLVAALLVTVLP